MPYPATAGTAHGHVYMETPEPDLILRRWSKKFGAGLDFIFFPLNQPAPPSEFQ